MSQDALTRALTTVIVEMARRLPPTPTWEMIQTSSPVIPHLAEVAQRWTACLGDDELLGPFVGLGRFYAGQGLYAIAEPWYEACLSKAQDRLGAEHPAVATSLNNLAALYQVQGRYGEAEPLHRRALAIREEALGATHPAVATVRDNYTFLLADMQSNVQASKPLLQRIRAWWSAKRDMR